MAGNKFNSPQVVSKDVLSRLYKAADYFATDDDNVDLKTLLQSIDLNFRPPLEMTANTPADLVLNIGAINVVNTVTDRNRVIPPISNLLPVFTSGTVTFPASSGGNATPSVGNAIVITVSSGNFIKVGINLDANGDIVLQTGTEGASEAAASVPPTIANTFALGYVTLQNVGGTIQNITETAIYQYVGGGGGGSGSGDASSILETLKNEFIDAPYNLLTPIVFKNDQSTFVGGTSTGAFSLVSQQYEFSSAAQFLATLNLLDTEEFRSGYRDVAEIDLSVFWGAGKIDTAADYEVSRDAGISYQTITMNRIGLNTETFYGYLKFANESGASNSSKASIVATGGNNQLDTTVRQAAGQIFTTSAQNVLRSLDLQLFKTGSPLGNIFISLVRDNAGVPSTSADDVIYTSNAIASSSITTGVNTFDIGRVVLPAGSYHIVLSSDATYKASYSSGVTSIGWRVDSGSTGTNFNGTTWSSSGGVYGFDIKGYTLDLRVRITASAGSKALDGLGIFYDRTTGGVTVPSAKNITKVSFLSVTNNTSTFTMPFLPEPDLLKVYYLEAGQVFRAPINFTIIGNNVVFPTNFFQNGGVDATVTLIFDQTKGGSFDNSDQNAGSISNLNTLGTKVETNLAAVGINVALVSGGYTDVSGLSLVIPNAGTWLVSLSNYINSSAGGAAGGDYRILIRDAANNVLMEREVYESMSANQRINFGVTIPIVTTGALTIKVSMFLEGGGNHNATWGSNGGGRTYFNAVKVGL